LKGFTNVARADAGLQTILAGIHGIYGLLQNAIAMQNHDRPKDLPTTHLQVGRSIGEDGRLESGVLPLAPGDYARSTSTGVLNPLFHSLRVTESNER
jgi:hypothetical protein